MKRPRDPRSPRAVQEGAAKTDDPGVTSRPCSCCGLMRPPAAEVRLRPVRSGQGWETDLSRPGRRLPVCRTCEAWLAGLLRDARESPIATLALHGTPSPGARVLMFEDQCHICHVMPGGTGALLSSAAVLDGLDSWAAIFLCPACEAWFGSLAEDGRSARGNDERSIDGPYGAWPHPNLRGLRLHLSIRDAGARGAVLESCEAMGVSIVERADADTVIFVDAGTRGQAQARLKDELPRRGRVLLANLSARDDLLRGLALGATAWLTIPLTPQQVTAALTSALRQRGLRLNWDQTTGLAYANLAAEERIALRCEPAAGADRFELAWLLKRFSRGYDDVVLADGQIVLLPRVPAEQADAVIARLERLLAGRCRLARIERGGLTRRFEAAG